jgi:ATP-dependent Clp protease ATP-binding subunit ClpC
MASLGFDYHSPRAVQSRFAERLTPVIRAMLGLTVAILLLVGLGLLYAHYAVGWLVLGLAAAPLCVLVWYKRELYRLDIDDPKSTNMDQLMSSSVVGQLPKDPSPKEIALAVGRVASGSFLATRFGMGPKFLVEIAQDSSENTEEIWQNAVRIRDRLGVRIISGGILAIAILQTLPRHEDLLARLQLDLDDLLDGVKWFDHIYFMVDRVKRPMQTGGIARDWSFGYTPTLDRYGINLSMSLGMQRMSSDTPTHETTIDQIIEAFSKGGRQNVALVGDAGVGKTTIVESFAERLLDAGSSIPSNLKFRQVFLLDSGSIISAAPGRGEVEQLVGQIIHEAYRAKNVILCLDNAHLFFEDAVGSVNIANLLMPILEAGRVRMILAIDEQRLLQIGQTNPGIVNALNRINVAPADEAETLAAMEDAVLQLESQHKVVYMYQALKEAYRLAGRYIYDLAMPGQAIKLLEMSARYAEEGKFVTAVSVEQAIEQSLGVKVGTSNIDEEREKLLNLEDLIHQRMIDQTRAVGVVCDALRRARTGVRNQDRPIGTFLFLGPTGVGKTELAKSLAAVYFNGEDNLVRVDLNQFVTIDDVQNLTADAADNPTSLTAQVMKRPFSVVLLDEIEKAHPNVLTALLQVLDEGVLRDAKSREVSFRDCIVIATSNAGAERIRELIGQGEDIDQFEDQLVNELIDSNQFRPEFLNRFDEIVLFGPLGKDELLQVVDIIVSGVNKTLANQKIRVEVETDAKASLVAAGYDPRLGARPMRRVVQRVVENNVAKKVLSGEAAGGSVIKITKADVDAALAKK